MPRFNQNATGRQSADQAAAEQSYRKGSFQEQAARRRAAAERQQRLADIQRRRQKQAAKAAAQQKRQAQQAASARARSEAQSRARKSRTEQAALQRRQQYTVKKGEGPAEIAKATGASAQAIAGLSVNKFVAGQVLDIVAPAQQQEQQIQQPDAPTAGGVYDVQTTPFTRTERNIQGATAARQALPDIVDNVQTFWRDFKDMVWGGGRDRAALDLTEQPVAEGSTQAVAQQAAQDYVQSQGGALEDSWQRTETRPNPNDPEAGYSLDYSKPLSKEQEALNMDMYTARYEYKAVQYVQNTGDMAGRPSILSRFFIESLTYEQKMNLLEDQGYVIDENGRYIAQDLPDVGYGLGGYGDYDYGSGGGEEYVPPRNTTAYHAIKVGGRVGRSRERLTSGYVPSSHWRI